MQPSCTLRRWEHFTEHTDVVRRKVAGVKAQKLRPSKERILKDMVLKINSQNYILNVKIKVTVCNNLFMLLNHLCNVGKWCSGIFLLVIPVFGIKRRWSLEAVYFTVTAEKGQKRLIKQIREKEFFLLSFSYVLLISPPLEIASDNYKKRVKRPSFQNSVYKELVIIPL